MLTGSPKEWETTYRVNVLGVVNTLQAFVPAMVRQSEQSLVVVTGSVAGLLQGSVGEDPTPSTVPTTMRVST